MRSDDIRCRIVLGACYCDERIYGGDRMAKYWSDCSAEEKAEVKQIEKEQKSLREQFKMGAISHPPGFRPHPGLRFLPKGQLVR